MPIRAYKLKDEIGSAAIPIADEATECRLHDPFLSVIIITAPPEWVKVNSFKN